LSDDNLKQRNLKILAVSYSQTGQLDKVMQTFLAPFAGLEVDRIQIETDPRFPFPWPTDDFFDAMPETVLEIPVKLEPIRFREEKYDLVVLAYQPWFLSPSLPITSLLQHPEFLRRLKDTPVVTLSAGRNMWLNAQESIRKRIREAGGRLVANIPLVDRNPNLVSVVTIIHWLIGGKKDRKWGIFPMPGVSEEDIAFGETYGREVRDALEKSEWKGLQPRLLSYGKIGVPTDILFIEERAKRLFLIWATLIRKRGNTPSRRRRWVSAFKYYLLTALFVVSPILLSGYYILVWPFTRKQLLKKKQYFCGVEE